MTHHLFKGIAATTDAVIRMQSVPKLSIACAVLWWVTVWGRADGEALMLGWEMC